MNELLQFVVRHGYVLVFAWVFVEQAGLPIPSSPLLLATGALAGMHQMNLWVALAIAAFAAVCSDSMWYALGRQKGVRVLQLLCRISLEPDSCVRRTQVSFGKNGANVLLVSKFVPGLNAAAVVGDLRADISARGKMNRNGELIITRIISGKLTI